MKTRIPPLTVQEGSRNFTMTPIENHLHLQAMVSLRLRNRQIGAYLLKKNRSAPWQLVFGFNCEGIHSFLSAEEVDGVFDQVEAGLKDFPRSEAVTFHLGAFKTDRDRQSRLSSLFDRSPGDEVKFLLMGERQRVRELAATGLREPKLLKVYVTYTFGNSEAESADWTERALAKLEESLSWIRGEGAANEAVKLESLLGAGFNNGYLVWEQLFLNKLKLKIAPMTEIQMWESLWYRLNPRTPPIDIPQLLILDENGIREEITSEVHSTTLLFADSVPRADRKWVHNGGKYTGALTFWDKPAGWKDKRQQLHYLWDVIARDLVTDTEIFCQISPANPTLVRTTVQRLIKQSTTAAVRASERQDVDVAAGINAKRSIEAQESLYEGAVPFHTGIVFLVHRESLEELDDACRQIENFFLRPAWVVRETEIAWHIWLQTLPIVQEKLLSFKYGNRRLVYLSKELPGLIPLVTTLSPDRDGLELLAEDGGTPIHIDLFRSEGKHLGVFGTTRSGKSVLVSGILTHALARNVPVVALDYPKPDGTSTFTDYTEFVSPLGAYFDVGAEAINLFERPDLSALAPDEARRRFEDYKDFLSACLLAMVVGVNTEETLKTTIRTVLYCLLNRFFSDPTILDRYTKAETGGPDSEEWQEMPTLRDYLRFCTLEEIDRLLQLEEGVNWNIVPKALEQIRLRLTYWVNSRVGKAISSPSTVPTDSMLLVFALRQVSQSEDAAILSLVAYAAALRRAMASPMSIFFIDESPILFQFPEIAQLVAMLCANGAKAGIRVILTAQDPNTIAAAGKVGAQILQNLSVRLIGRIQRAATPSFISIFGYQGETIAQCERFLPNKQGVFTRWLLDDSGIYTFCRYYPAYVQLAVVANNPDEQAIRAEYLSRYPDKFEAIAFFSRILSRSLRSGESLSELFEEEKKGLPSKADRFADLPI
ncbi:DUF87 domain-containing protein [Pannus brasiliensis CCIBt3594]|uniref:DUF87 domain-containing protein n=1 Tax=Pannus brasiliensis CCIBt3594 TaxID=1427578 RepID=A0AAW9QW33_9CHRO